MSICNFFNNPRIFTYVFPDWSIVQKCAAELGQSAPSGIARNGANNQPKITWTVRFKQKCLYRCIKTTKRCTWHRLGSSFSFVLRLQKKTSKYRIKTTRKWNRLTASQKIYRYFNHTIYRNEAFHWAIHHQILKTPIEYTYPSSRDWYMYIAPEVQAHNYAWLFTSTVSPKACICHNLK